MGPTRRLVKLAYALEDSPRYVRAKRFFYDLLESPHARMRSWFDLFMILLVLASVLLLVLAVRQDTGRFGLLFERFAVAVFIAEYLLRLWVYNDARRIVIEHYERAELLGVPFRPWHALREILAKKWDYVSSPLAVIDLLAIIPSYRPLRFLRIFLLFRLFKLFRYTRSINEFVKVLSEKRFELTTVGVFLAFVVLIGATIIYIFESGGVNPKIDSVFDGIYWALVTLSTVGYGDITPQSAEGRLVTMVLIVTGIGVLSFTTSIIVSAFHEKMPEVRANRVYAEIEKRGGHTIICGFGRVGRMVAGQLAGEREHFVVIDRDPERVTQAKKLGYLAIEGNAETTDLLENTGIRRQARRILCLTGDDVSNVYITLTARYLNPEITIISRANREETVRKLVQAGADHTVSPFKVVGLIAAQYIGQPVAFEAVYGMLTGQKEIGVQTLTVSEGSALEGRALEELDLRANRLILFGVITRGSRESEAVRLSYELGSGRFHFNPGRGFRLQDGDVLVVFGHRLSLVHFKKHIERESR
ncbi:MAG: NAD-binding protein [Chromatiales bacterium]|jgi:voltage-gated potassium channel